MTCQEVAAVFSLMDGTQLVAKLLGVQEMRGTSLQKRQASHGTRGLEVRSSLVALLLTVGLLLIPAPGTPASSFAAETTVYFSPNGGATAAIVRELGSAQHRILVQAYSFTSAPIAKALLDARQAGR